ncbi:MAG: ABC transporter substrate-binding protein [Gemmatimonadetes bacterium]|uniref:ABC transporter substrate-binding protein n=1 Tax=Candidatus Kutchimonas denitrificans TaxID=3056748 RepID=A0AAE5CBT3_9BACT|nr:ABC transporter substrate-binding protein [Gemmatimonadota bacterium]NIR74820.1 ABC transporter substrate-binding protein [Candidatus Kutchimonas denitrificans]NIR99931.1 ABC transporter substrate-binding protein [Gemmatimonadota bacterium]NIT65515.1 ABC transporter substrate-binding protein [Gemmatimonadota bacterium]NIU52485.1 ABC transporter substrate-binding protein [Gemmatimonadota bacterium]
MSDARWPFVLALAALAACGGTDRVVVVSKNFTEQTILAELVAQQLERRTELAVERRFFLGGTFVCHRALVSGEADIYVEYTGTALTAILEKPPLNDPEAVYDTVSRVYGERFDLVWGEPLGFDNTFAILVRGDDARRLGLETISDVAAYTPDWRAGFGYEFMEREDGFPGLAEAYGLEFAEPSRTMDLGLTYRALADGQVDLIAGNSTDGLIAALDLVQLEDDRSYFPPYEAAPVIGAELLSRNPEIEAALDELGGRISDDEMRRLNYLVDVEHRDLAAVVRAWLEENVPSTAGADR